MPDSNNRPPKGLEHFPPGAEQYISHPAQARPGINVFPDKLYVITVLEDPLRWRSRYLNYHEFARQVECQGGILITVELATGERAFELTDADNPYHLQVRTRDELWHKENLGNLGAALLPLGVKYLSFVDSDMLSTRQDWFQETLHQLQLFDIVQMYSSYSDMSSEHAVLRTSKSFLWNYWNLGDIRPPNPKKGWERWWEGYYDSGRRFRAPGATGGAWAYRIEAFNALGCLMDRCILGAADWYMAFALVQAIDPGPESEHVTDQYKNFILSWSANARRIKANVGYVDAHLVHKWHGPKALRQYGERWKVLSTNQYNPWYDIQPNAWGVWELKGNKPRLRDEIRRYMRGRHEDFPQ
jgi:hypothetical protein